MEYLVAGYTMVNDIVFADGSKVTNQLGGTVFSAAGVKLWRDSLAYVGVAGQDFEDLYGDFFGDNHIQCLMQNCIPETLRYEMHYGADGTWQEVCTQGQMYERRAAQRCHLRTEHFAPGCDRNTRGVYLEASLDNPIAQQFPQLKCLFPRGVLMWEIATSDLLDPRRKACIEECIAQVDAYSMNLHEARHFFDTDSVHQVLAGIQKLGKPCFLRAGEQGAYWLEPGQIAFLPALEVDQSVDATGCGNCSTAAAMIGFAEELPAEITLAMANVSAAYNARQYGPWPLCTPQVRAEAREKMEKLAARCRFLDT